jgi:hypothetical protein
MNLHDLLWAYLTAIRCPVATKAWLAEANRILSLHGMERQSDALSAQRLLKNITKHYLFLL